MVVASPCEVGNQGTLGRKTFPRKVPLLCGSLGCARDEQRYAGASKSVGWASPGFSAHVRWCEHGAPVECAVDRTVHCSLNLTQAGRLLLMNNRTLEQAKALEGLRPAFSAHVRWCEHGAPVQCAGARTVHCSHNLTQAGRLLLMNNGTLEQAKAFEGLRPAFSAHVRWCEHGAPIECAAAGTVHCSLNWPQAGRLLLMNKPYPGPTKSVGWALPGFFGHVSWCEHGAPVQCAVPRSVHINPIIFQAFTAKPVPFFGSGSSMQQVERRR